MDNQPTEQEQFGLGELSLSATNLLLKEDLKAALKKAFPGTQSLLVDQEWLMDQQEQLTQEEQVLLQQGEEQFTKGEFTWWRDVKRTEV